MTDIRTLSTLLATENQPVPRPLSVGERSFLHRMSALPVATDFGQVEGGPPEMDEGTMNVHLPGNPTLLAEVICEKITEGVYIEHWVVLDTTLLSANEVIITKADSNAGNVEARLTARKAEPGGPGFLYARVELTYKVGLKTSAIEQLPQVLPPGRDIRVSDVFNVINTVSQRTGAVYVEIEPVGSLRRVEHWVYRKDKYQFPTAGVDPVSTRLQRRLPQGPPPQNSPPPPPAGGPLRFFLLDYFNAEAALDDAPPEGTLSDVLVYVFASYAWGPLP